MALKVPSPDAGSEPVMQPAAKLTVGDRIAAGFLPERDAAEIGFVHRYLRADEPWVFVAYTFADRSANSSYFRADALIPLEGVADFTGLTYTRADSDADDPTPVSPARVPLHTGSVVDGGELITDKAVQ